MDDLSIGNRSRILETKDSHSLLSESQNEMRESQIIQVLIPEAFRHVLPFDVGDEIEIAIGLESDPNRIFIQDFELYRKVFKARIVGTVKKIPGIYDISAYRPVVYTAPSVVISER
jgi:hypothetical protein